MRKLRRSRILAVIACWIGVQTAVPVHALTLNQITGQAQVTAPEPPPAAAPDSVAALERARTLIRNGEYDEAIETLKASISRARAERATLRDAYLLLIKTYVFLGNDLRFRPQGREASNLNYQEARKLIAECLGIEMLRHTQPEPASEYPPEMIAFFAEVRSKIFGSFRVSELRPPTALVFLDADTLRPLPGDSLPGDVNLEVGPHRVAVMAKGYRPLTQEIVISPNAVLERSYRLTRKRGPAWYASASGAALALVLGIYAVGKGSAGTPPGGLEPLPTAPPPPAR